MEGFDLLRVFQICGYLVASAIGLYRILRNHLYPKEQAIYIWASLITLYFGLVHVISQIHISFNTFPGLDLHTMIRVGYPFLIGVIIMFMIYYRRVPKRYWEG